jgi:hypothetical protein
MESSEDRDTANHNAIKCHQFVVNAVWQKYGRIVTVPAKIAEARTELNGNFGRFLSILIS